jgi:mono/diheme cytochrome c family protein
VDLTGPQVYADVCAQCHGANGEGGVGPALRDPTFQARVSDQYLYDTINLGHEATAMIGWGDILSADQIQQLVAYIRQLGGVTPTSESGGAPSFRADVLPLLQEKCGACHGTLGGWDASSYASVLQTGDHAPVVVPGDPPTSLLAQKLLGTQTVGGPMPPGSPLSQDDIQLLLDWIAAGALDN